MRTSVVLAGVLGGGALAVTGIVAATASPTTAATAFEAEAPANLRTGAAGTVACAPCSGGQRVAGIGYPGRLTVSGVTPQQAGLTPVRIAYTSVGQGYAELQVNERPAVVLTFPATGHPDSVGFLDVRLRLDAGANTLTFAHPLGWAPDLDKVTVDAGDVDAPEPTATPSTTPPGLATLPPARPTPAASRPALPGPAEPTRAAPTVTRPAVARPRPVRPNPVRPAPPQLSGPAALEATVVRLVNAERAEHGCDVALTAELRLAAAARRHSADMAANGYFSHTSRDGTRFAERISEQAYRWSGVAENIAKGQRTAAEVMRSWMNSPGHRANILNCAYEHIGVGVAIDGGTVYWTQDFGSPR